MQNPGKKILVTKCHSEKIQSRKNMDTHITSLSLTNRTAEKPNEIEALNNTLRQIKQAEEHSDCCFGSHFQIFQIQS